MLARDLVRVGLVNSVNSSNGTVDVLFPDRDNSISSDLPLLNSEYDIPSVGDQVLCLFQGNGTERGYCLGGFYSQKNPPPVADEDIFMKKFDDSTSIQYNKSTKTLKVISSSPVTLEGNFMIHGNLTVNGNINATGTITES